MPPLATAQDAAAGFEIQLRFGGTKEVIGRWHNAVRVNPPPVPRHRCGPRIREGRHHGHPVALLGRYPLRGNRPRRRHGRAPGDARYAFEDVTPKLFETSGEKRFVLAVGPLPKRAAEKLRWNLLEAGAEAKISLAKDLEGDPKPLP